VIVRRAKVIVFVFGSNDDVVGDQHLKATAEVPTIVISGDVFKHGSLGWKPNTSGFQLISRITARAIKQELINRVTDPWANGQDVIDPCLAKGSGPITAWGSSPVQTWALSKA
jgi:hypothetical protein